MDATHKAQAVAACSQSDSVMVSFASGEGCLMKPQGDKRERKTWYVDDLSVSRSLKLNVAFNFFLSFL